MAETSPNTDEASGDPSGLRERIVLLLKIRWKGNQRRMARDLGISQASISRVERGVQKPGLRLVSAIAAHPQISDTWLHTGRGEPIVATSAEAPGDGWSLPVVTRSLPGKPEDYANRLSGMVFPVVKPLYRNTCYYLKVSKEIGLAPDEDNLDRRGGSAADGDERTHLDGRRRVAAREILRREGEAPERHPLHAGGRRVWAGLSPDGTA